MISPILPLPDRVSKAASSLLEEAERFRSGKIGAEEFRGLRVPQGLYEQRTAGTYMLRVRVPGGLSTPAQLRGLSELAATHGCVRLHLTTRQDIQFHELALEGAVSIQQALPSLGLTARGTGGNTVRNVTIDPLSGVARDEAFDVRPHALAVTGLLLDRDGTDTLPRKFKVAFSGSYADRAGATIADLGFIARMRDGRPGFLVFVGGGLGTRARTGVRLSEWIPADESLLVAEAICGLFAEHGDRRNKASARLRHVLARLGEGAFLALCHEAIARVRRDGPCGPVPPVQPVNSGAARRGSPLADGALARLEGVVPEREEGLFSLRIAPPLGDFSPQGLEMVARLADVFAAPIVRAGLDQELWLTGVAGADLREVVGRLQEAPVGAPGTRALIIPACAGASTCKLGLLRSRGAAEAISSHLDATGKVVSGLDIRISGCPNSCGRHLVAGLGLEGRVKRVDGRQLPCYEVFAGGRHGALDACLGRRLGTIPAKRIPAFVAAVADRQATTPDAIGAIVAEHAVVPTPVPEDWFIDWGGDRQFNLEGLGEGECAAGAGTGV